MARPLLAALLLPICMAHVRVLAYGDSLTAGFWDGGRQFHPYSTKLSELLGGCTVDHIGLSGWTTGEMRATLSVEEAAAAAAEAASVARHGGRPMDGFGRSWLTLPEALAKRPGYTHVVILGGTNDLATALLASHHELPGQEGEAQPGEHYAVPVLAHLRRLHEAARATGAVSVAVTVPEVAFETSEERVRAMRLEVNRGLKLLAKSYPRGAMLVADAAEAMPLSGIDPEEKKARWDDGLHFSPAGYDQLAAVIREALGTQGCGGNGTAGRALKRTPALLSSARTDV